MSTRTANALVSNTGFLAVVQKFLSSVESLNDTVLFPVRLQDIESQVSPDNQILQFIRHTASDDSEAMDLFAVYMLLLNTKSELLTGNDVTGAPSGSETVIGEQLRTMTLLLKNMTDMANTIRKQYESSLC